MRIYLIGMPLSGKTTTGKLLAEKLKFNFVDTDIYIEEELKVSIDGLLLNNKEEEFRTIESKALKDQIKKENTVISTGGGIVVKEENKGFMDGFVVFLDVDIETLKKREKEDKKRPLLTKTTIEKTYNNRISKYRLFADLIIKDENVELVVCKIIRALEEKGDL